MEIRLGYRMKKCFRYYGCCFSSFQIRVINSRGLHWYPEKQLNSMKILGEFTAEPWAKEISRISQIVHVSKDNMCERQGSVISGSIKVEILGSHPGGLGPPRWIFLTNFSRGSLSVSSTVKSSSLFACG